MTDDLIGPQPEGPKHPTPWQASNWGNLEDASGYTLYFAANGVPLEESKKLGPAIVDAVNAYYGGMGPLQDKACRDLDAKDARIADLERKLKRAHDTMADLHRDKDDAEKRAEAAEARVNLFQRYHQEDMDEIAALGKRAKKAEARANYVVADRDRVEGRKVEALERAEAAEARVRDLEHQLEGTTESLEEARSAYLQLSKERMEESLNDIVSRMAIPSYSIRVDTYTAPDGRVFRVGQRVKDVRTDEIGVVDGFNPLSDRRIVVRLGGLMSEYDFDLRRVWDGTEEPDVPVGTVIRDADGMYFRNDGDGWELWHSGTGKWSTPLPWNEWDHSEEVRPYVEVLPEDD